MHDATSNITVWRADWHPNQAIICDIRRQVFIEEQQVPASLEWDGLDETAVHVLGHLGGNRVCATARLLTTGQIGRMAVLPDCRYKGLGSALLAELVSAAANAGMYEVSLHAQLQARCFYERHGFSAVGSTFKDAGIPHIAMIHQVA